MFPIHNCRFWEEARAVYWCTSNTTPSILPPSPENPTPPHTTSTLPQICRQHIFHFNISIFMFNLYKWKKFKVTKGVCIVATFLTVNYWHCQSCSLVYLFIYFSFTCVYRCKGRDKWMADVFKLLYLTYKHCFFSRLASESEHTEGENNLRSF